MHNIIDMLLLPGVFENFRKNIHKKCDLDSISFVSVPSLSWMSALKKTKIELAMLHSYENGIRRGITRTTNHYAGVNNKYMNNFDPYKSP